MLEDTVLLLVTHKYPKNVLTVLDAQSKGVFKHDSQSDVRSHFARSEHVQMPVEMLGF